MRSAHHAPASCRRGQSSPIGGTSARFLIGALLVLSVAASACGADEDVAPVPNPTGSTTTTVRSSSTPEPEASAAADAEPAEEEPDSSEPTGPTTSATVGLPVVLAGDGDGFKTLAPNLERVGSGVVAFADTSSSARIEELATAACGDVQVDMTDSQLGSAGLAAYDALTVDEQQSIVESDWVVFYGALVGYFCPDRLPLESLEDAPPIEGTALDQFRVIVSRLDGVSAEAESFAAGVSDRRLEELRDAACSNTSSDMTTEDFGLLIVSSYGQDLSDADRQAVSLSSYGELYGAIVGWFCPENLPL